MKMFRFSTFLIVALGLSGCEYVVPTIALRGYEQNDRDCRDGFDNDADGLIDCEDPDCFYGSVNCGQDNIDTGLTFDEATVTKCHDFIDNDGDGQYDCADKDCQGLPEACCSYEFTDAACSNGIDDDQNGRIDCEDYSCSKGLFVTVCDYGASARACDEVGPEDTVEACSDGCDNDGNGFVDCDDFSCSRSDNPEVKQLCEERLSDGSSSSFALEGEAGPEDTSDACQDGIDNDGNGFTDCQDFSCSRNADPNIAALCPTEDSADTCSDGIDNDGNGFVDCADFSCSQSDNIDVREVCQESLYQPSDWQGKPDQVVAGIIAAVRTNCTDSNDNDGDGFIDCDDFDCSWHPLALTATGEHLCAGRRVCE